MGEEKTIRRTEDRLRIETRGATFLGSRPESGQVFEYILNDLTASGIGFSIPNSARSAVGEIGVGAELMFHLPFLLGGRFYASGEVRWVKQGDDQISCGASLDHAVPLVYPVYVSLDSGEVTFSADRDADLMHHIVKDAWLLKRGIDVYFKHLGPYFRRMGKGNGAGHAAFIESFTRRLQGNIRALDAMHRQIRADGFQDGDWDLGAFRKAILPEADTHDFPVQFGSASVLPYLSSIRRLDLRLYGNYNAMVLMLLAGGQAVVRLAPVRDRRAARR